MHRLRRACDAFREQVAVYRLVMGHPRTPRRAKVLLGIAVAYAASPVDLIPDCLPVIGHLDDVLIVPLLVWAAKRAVPGEVMDECRHRVRNRHHE